MVKMKMSKKFEQFEDEEFVREVVPNGTSARINIPKKFLGRFARVKILSDKEAKGVDKI